MLYRQASTGPFAAEIATLRGRIVGRAAFLLAEGVDAAPADVEPFAHTLVGAAEGLADWWLGRGPRPPRSRRLRTDWAVTTRRTRSPTCS